MVSRMRWRGLAARALIPTVEPFALEPRRLPTTRQRHELPEVTSRCGIAGMGTTAMPVDRSCGQAP